MENLSKSFLAYAKEISKSSRDQKEPCEFCFSLFEPSELEISPVDLMAGKLCLECRGTLKQFSAPVIEKKVRVKSDVPVDPKKAGVIGWIQELVFRDEKVSVVKLRGEMEDKKYSQGTINAQMGRIKKAYHVTSDFIFLDKECAAKLGGGR